MDYPPKSNHVSSKGYISLYLWHPIFYFEFGSFPHLCSSQQFMLSFGRFSIVSMGEKKNVGFHFAPGLEQNTKKIKFYRATLVYIILNFFLRSL